MTQPVIDIDVLAQETIEDLRSKLDPALSKTKGLLFFRKGSGFLGALLGKLEMRWTRQIRTAAIGATTLYWNPDFFLSLDRDTRITVLAHELYHNAFLHGARMGDRCPDIWNIAADHVINNLLEDDGFFMDGFPYVKDAKYKGWSTNDVYDDLINQGPGGAPGGPCTGQSPGQASGQPQNTPGGQAPGDGLGSDIIEYKGIEKDTAVANVVGAKTVARMTGTAPGDIPGEVELVIETFLNPKLPWETILFNFFNALTSEEYSYTRPNRRYEDPILPGPIGRNGLEHLIYYLDISGSISDDDILRFNSEVKFIKDQLRPELLSLVTFDTVIHDEYHFERDEPFEKIVVTGRGGTSLHEVFDHARRHAPTAMVVFTDLEVSIPENPGVPIIWVCTNNPGKNVPYGQLIHIDSAGNVRHAEAAPEAFTWGPDPGPTAG